MPISKMKNTERTEISAFFDCEFVGESAFLLLSQGQVGTFSACFVNTGTVAWIRSTPTQVDLAICRPGEGCDLESPQNDWNPGSWLSPRRYATHSQQEVGPGQVGTFTYSVQVPTVSPGGTHRFHGELVESRSGKLIHPVGYFQDVTIAAAAAAAAAVITALEPSEGGDFMAEEVRIRGAGFRCTPSPTVAFGDEVAEVLVCSSGEIIVAAPSHALPAKQSRETVSVVVGNAGEAASNALAFTYVRSSAAANVNESSLSPDSEGSPGASVARDAIRKRLAGATYGPREQVAADENACLRARSGGWSTHCGHGSLADQGHGHSPTSHMPRAAIRV